MLGITDFWTYVLGVVATGGDDVVAALERLHDFLPDGAAGTDDEDAHGAEFTVDPSRALRAGYSRLMAETN